MNIDKAIELNDIILVNFDSDLDEDEKDAIQLGIEALKFYKGIKECIAAYKGTLLPGETKE